MKLARLAVSGLVIGSLLAIDNLAFADPDAVRDAKAKLDSLNEQVSQIEQEGIAAKDDAEKAKKKLERAREDVEAQMSKVAELSDAIGGSAVMQMQRSGLGSTFELLSSTSEDSFLSSLATVQSENDRAAASVQQLQLDQAKLDVLRAQAAAAKQEMDENLAEHEEKLAEYKQKQSEAEAIYDRLNAEEQARLRELREQQEREAQRRAEAQAAAMGARSEGGTSRTLERSAAGADTQNQAAAAQPAVAAPNSGRASTVINAAMAQIGKSYVFGAAGPNAFDCSGLTSWAYRQAGVNLPRTSQAQYGVGRAVSLADIQPGDLVFYYGQSPSHVAIYIGNGQVVHASNPRNGIRTSGMHYMPLSGIRRVL